MSGFMNFVLYPLLLLDRTKIENVHENEGVPVVFPVAIYNGYKVWEALQEMPVLFIPMSRA